MVKMIEINVDPYIFRAGTFGIMWSSLIEVVAIALALYLFIIKAKPILVSQIKRKNGLKSVF